MAFLQPKFYVTAVILQQQTEMPAQELTQLPDRIENKVEFIAAEVVQGFEDYIVWEGVEDVQSLLELVESGVVKQHCWRPAIDGF